MVKQSDSVVPVRVLVADDATVFRQKFIYNLASVPGVEVVGEARNGREALELNQALQPDLLTLDIMMPEMNGIELLRELSRGGHRPRTIVMTNYPSPLFRRKCLELGANAFMDKALDYDRVLEIVRGNCDG